VLHRRAQHRFFAVGELAQGLGKVEILLPFFANFQLFKSLANR
jgi:hypothetical protein